MRYLQNAEYHKPQGPIYIFVGGEWTITPGLLSTGLTHDMAVENGGMLYYTEHRYYGQSWPHENNSLTVAQLQHLSLEQALADLAYFIRYQKSHNPHLNHSKVILIGGSYSGSMATWMTQLYPELIAASWASSAPLLAKADFHEYMKLVSSSLQLSYGHNCTERLEMGLQHLVELFKANETESLLKALNACGNFNAMDALDRISFFNGIGNYFALIVQSYSTYIPVLCNALLRQQSSEEKALQNVLEQLYADDTQCQDFSYQAMLQLFEEHSDQSSGTRAWLYQTCNQFGWYTTTISDSNSSSSFGSQVPLWYFEHLCRDSFGAGQTSSKLQANIARLNAQFGGIAFNQSERYREVIFTHGQLDPWRALGQQHGNQAIVLSGYSHVEDLTSINVRDTVSMNLAKLRVMSFLRRHIAAI
ncbi:putative serine protease K12H4.7 [Drosophila albomicans]|uniref:Serine protease K12H4.7 n=1 Tax=Drosophila albomicans TaxID=7291 RepID=A0A6P8XHQ6_DROAB|nr:putative serine protease K12H4.7 [Drosophila albomicans]